MPSKRTLVVLISTSLVAGCAVGPDYQCPEISLSERFLGQDAVEQRPVSSTGDLIDWWAGFGDPQLTRLVTLALQQNLDLAQAEARIAQARASLGAANAALLPSGSVSGQAARAYQSVETPLGQVLDSTPGLSGVLGLRWRLFDFGRIDAQIDLAKGQEAEQLAAYRLAALRATEGVENAFSALVKRELQTRVLEQGVDSLSRARQASFEAYQQGVVSLIEVLQADENLLRATDARAQARTESARAGVAAFKALGGDWKAHDALAAK